MAGAAHTTSALRRWTACAVFSATMFTELPCADHRRPRLARAIDADTGTDTACRRPHALDAAQAPAGTDRGGVDAGAWTADLRGDTPVDEQVVRDAVTGAAPPAAAMSHAARSPHRERSHPIFGL